MKYALNKDEKIRVSESVRFIKNNNLWKWFKQLYYGASKVHQLENQVTNSVCIMRLSQHV